MHSPDAKTNPAEQSEVNSGPLRILVVDDEELVLMTTSLTLETLGYAVDKAQSAREALDYFKNSAVPDLLIVDMMMPEMSGLDLYNSLFEEGIRVRTLFYSGYSKDYDRIPTGDGHCTGFLAKPFLRAELSSALKSILDH